MPGKPLREIPIAAADAPGCREFFDYWASKREGGEVPRRRAFDPLLEIPHLAPRLFLLDVVEGGRDVRVRLMGTQVIAMFAADVTGRLVSEIWFADELAECFRLCRKCVETGEPVAAEGSYHWLGRGYVAWQCVMTPVRRDGADQLLCLLCRTSTEEDEEAPRPG
jgi:hypothetical protein